MDTSVFYKISTLLQVSCMQQHSMQLRPMIKCDYFNQQLRTSPNLVNYNYVTRYKGLYDAR